MQMDVTKTSSALVTQSKPLEQITSNINMDAYRTARELEKSQKRRTDCLFFFESVRLSSLLNMRIPLLQLLSSKPSLRHNLNRLGKTHRGQTSADELLRETVSFYRRKQKGFENSRQGAVMSFNSSRLKAEIWHFDEQLVE